jgi:prepilin-type N-terminal cleavage/methylation domain-containing protein
MKITVSGVAVRQKGFTLVEVLLAFTILVVVMSGMTMALTASMRLGVYQNQRSLAQDIVRNVNNRWLKSGSYTTIVPETMRVADGEEESEYVAPAISEVEPFTHNLYSAKVGNTTNALSTYRLQDLQPELARLPNAHLEVEITPVALDNGAMSLHKANALIRLRWGRNTGAEVTQAMVIGMGDLGRAPTSLLIEPITLEEQLAREAAKDQDSEAAADDQED